jgi:hypothetical protein
MGENIQEQELHITLPAATRTFSLINQLELIFLGVLSLSFLGFFIFRGSWIGYVFAHTAGLSMMVFYASLTGVIARWKGFNHRLAFRTALLAPIILGIISAFVLPATVDGMIPITCGGWTALGTGLIVVLAALVFPGRANRTTAEV